MILKISLAMLRVIPVFFTLTQKPFAQIVVFPKSIIIKKMHFIPPFA
jgi:hypothetical protein